MEMLLKGLKGAFMYGVCVASSRDKVARVIGLVVMFLIVGMFAKPATAQAGMTSFVMGLSSGTSAVNVCGSSGGDYYNIKVGSAAAGGYIKCFNTATLSAAALGAEANMIDLVVVSSATNNASPLSNTQSPVDAREGATNAASGITCTKSAAGDIYFIRVKCS